MALFKFLHVKKTIDSPTNNHEPKLPDGWHTALPGKTLLQKNNRQYLLKKIKLELSITNAIWQHCYLKLFENWASFVQLLPASETHHHSYPGGLLDHTLECTLNALRLRRGYILPANEPVEHISLKADRYTYAVCVASLLHDCGKVILDLNIVSGSPDDHKPWVPWTGYLKENANYAFRFRQGRKHGQHELAGSSLLSLILPMIGLTWLYEDKELIGLLLAQLTGKEAQAGAIGEIVRSADKESVGQAIRGGNTQEVRPQVVTKTNTVSIHEQLLMAIRYLFHEGVLQLNRPGAAGWIVDGRAWLVSKSVVEAAITHLSSEGVTSIPKNVARVFDILLEHGLVMPSENGKSVWKCKIYDSDRDWHQELTMLCFDQDLLWPNEKPEKFNGTVTPVVQKIEKKPDPLADTEVVLDKLVGKDSSSKTVQKDKMPAGKTIKKNIDIGAKKQQSPSKDIDSSIAGRFLDWLVDGLDSKKIIVNDKNSLVHMVDSKVLLVSPSIFKLYLKENPAAMVALASSQGKDDIRKLQHHFQRLGLHERRNGINILEFEVEGDRRKSSSLRGYLITDPSLLFKGTMPTNNPHISILTCEKA